MSWVVVQLPCCANSIMRILAAFFALGLTTVVNVMYELGVAHAIGKPTIIIAKNFTEIPFDLNNKRMVIFKDDKDLISKLRDSMTDLLLNGVI